MIGVSGIDLESIVISCQYSVRVYEMERRSKLKILLLTLNLSSNIDKKPKYLQEGYASLEEVTEIRREAEIEYGYKMKAGPKSLLISYSKFISFLCR